MTGLDLSVNEELSSSFEPCLRRIGKVQVMSKSANRIYVREFLTAMAAYAVVLILSVTLINARPASAWWRMPLALTPVIPAIFAMVAYIRALGRMDELQRRIQLEALAIGFGGAGILTFSYGFLENVGLPL